VDREREREEGKGNRQADLFGGGGAWGGPSEVVVEEHSCRQDIGGSISRDRGRHKGIHRSRHEAKTQLCANPNTLGGPDTVNLAVSTPDVQGHSDTGAESIPPGQTANRGHKGQTFILSRGAKQSALVQVFRHAKTLCAPSLWLGEVEGGVGGAGTATRYTSMAKGAGRGRGEAAAGAGMHEHRKRKRKRKRKQTKGATPLVALARQLIDNGCAIQCEGCETAATQLKNKWRGQRGSCLEKVKLAPRLWTWERVIRDYVHNHPRTSLILTSNRGAGERGGGQSMCRQT